MNFGIEHSLEDNLTGLLRRESLKRKQLILEPGRIESAARATDGPVEVARRNWLFSLQSLKDSYVAESWRTANHRRLYLYGRSRRLLLSEDNAVRVREKSYEGDQSPSTIDGHPAVAAAAALDHLKHSAACLASPR